MKLLKLAYLFLWAFGIPMVVGKSVGGSLMRFYNASGKTFLAGLVVCVAAGAVVSWLPMAFIIHGTDFGGRGNSPASPLLLWFVASAAPLVIGFQHLGVTLSFLLTASTCWLLFEMGASVRRSNLPVGGTEEQ